MLIWHSKLPTCIPWTASVRLKGGGGRGLEIYDWSIDPISNITGLKTTIFTKLHLHADFYVWSLNVIHFLQI